MQQNKSLKVDLESRGYPLCRIVLKCNNGKHMLNNGQYTAFLPFS